MSPYRRAKREDAIKPSEKNLSISIGSSKYSFDTLQTMCTDKANELIKTMKLENGEEATIVFWTKEGMPELIGVAKISKNDFGIMTYSMDFSQTTL